VRENTEESTVRARKHERARVRESAEENIVRALERGHANVRARRSGARSFARERKSTNKRKGLSVHCNTLQHTATHRNTPQHAQERGWICCITDNLAHISGVKASCHTYKGVKYESAVRVRARAFARSVSVYRAHGAIYIDIQIYELNIDIYRYI